MPSLPHALQADNASIGDMPGGFLDAVGYQPSAEDIEAVAGPGTLDCLAEFLDDAARHFGEQGTTAETWLAGKIAELADRARFLGAITCEQYDDRERTLLMDQLTVRPTSKTLPGSRYRTWDVVDGLGSLIHSADLFDAMMTLQSRHPEV